MGPDGAGHYVKMVHNGIEYGDMQLICEAYAILKDVLGMEAAELADTFAEWNKGDLDSYLIEITSQIFRKIDPDTGKPLVDVILDKAGQKGTGLWTLAVRHQAVRRHFHDQRRRRSSRDFLAERRARRGLGNSAATEGAKVHGGSRAWSRRARRALRLEDCFVRAGDGTSRRGQRGSMESEFRRHRHDLARRLHHSREIPESNQGSL